jgi:predicted membrane-bound spermidine synthase
MARPRNVTAPAPPRSSPALLVTLVVIAGAVLMSLEMLGSRMLAPYFGSSVFVWGSLIGVFLASLSLGYWAGGYLADKRPSFQLLSALALAAAALIFLSWLITPPVCRGLADAGFGDRAGPLLASLAIFFVPSVLIGTVSPFAIRLSARSLGDIGIQAGRLSAISTFGSLLGTFGTTFVLIPALPVKAILMILGLALAVVPVFALVTTRRGAAAVAGGAAAVAAIAYVASTAQASTLAEGETLVYEGSSAYHQMAVVEKDGNRYLKFDQFYESGISLEPPHRGVFPYTELFDVGPLLTPEPKRALFLGAGGGVGPRAFAEAYPSLATIDVVDVDPLVLEVATRYFHLEENERIRLHAEDARMFLRRAREPYDVVVLDVFTIGGRLPVHLATREFFAEVAAHLAPGGSLVMNVVSAVNGPYSEIYAALSATIASVFGDVAAFPIIFPEEDATSLRVTQLTRNIILAAVKGGLPPAAEIRERGRASPSRGARWAAHLLAPRAPRGDVLTDEHAPIETMEYGFP